MTTAAERASKAVVAQAEHVEPMAVDLEALGVGELGNGTGYLLLQASPGA